MTKNAPSGREKSSSPHREKCKLVEVASVKPLTTARFPHLEVLFDQKGCSFARGCWCMAYREQKIPKWTGLELKAQRKAALLDLSNRKPSPGLIGYDERGVPVGWIAVGPRSSFPKLQTSRVMAAVDGKDVWSVVCFVVPSPFRGQRVASQLLEHAADYAATNNARILEGYPIDRLEPSQDQWLWHGTISMFKQAGFSEVARRKLSRPVMRKELTSISVGHAGKGSG